MELIFKTSFEIFEEQEENKLKLEFSKYVRVFFDSSIFWFFMF